MKILLKKILLSPFFYLIVIWWVQMALLWPLCNQPQLLYHYLTPQQYDQWENFTAFGFESFLHTFAFCFLLMSLGLAVYALLTPRLHGKKKAVVTMLYLFLAFWWLVAYIPGTGRARERTKRICCQNDLRQIYQFIQQYAADYQGYCPPDLQTLNQTDYLTDLDIYRCPSRTRPNEKFSDYEYFGRGRKLDGPAFLLLQDRDQNHPGKFYNNVMSDGEIKSGDKIATP